jgi:hypothetical protein
VYFDYCNFNFGIASRLKGSGSAARVANDVRSLGAADGVIESEMDHGLAIPVIIGQGCHARLFAMRLPSKSDRPVVEQVCFVSRTFE